MSCVRLPFRAVLPSCPTVPLLFVRSTRLPGQLPSLCRFVVPTAHAALRLIVSLLPLWLWMLASSDNHAYSVFCLGFSPLCSVLISLALAPGCQGPLSSGACPLGVEACIRCILRYDCLFALFAQLFALSLLFRLRVLTSSVSCPAPRRTGAAHWVLPPPTRFFPVPVPPLRALPLRLFYPLASVCFEALCLCGTLTRPRLLASGRAPAPPFTQLPLSGHGPSLPVGFHRCVRLAISRARAAPSLRGGPVLSVPHVSSLPSSRLAPIISLSSLAFWLPFAPLVRCPIGRPVRAVCYTLLLRLGHLLLRCLVGCAAALCPPTRCLALQPPCFATLALVSSLVPRRSVCLSVSAFFVGFFSTLFFFLSYGLRAPPLACLLLRVEWLLFRCSVFVTLDFALIIIPLLCLPPFFTSLGRPQGPFLGRARRLLHPACRLSARGRLCCAPSRLPPFFICLIAFACVLRVSIGGSARLAPYFRTVVRCIAHFFRVSRCCCCLPFAPVSLLFLVSSLLVFFRFFVGLPLVLSRWALSRVPPPCLCAVSAFHRLRVFLPSVFCWSLCCHWPARSLHPYLA